ncbi:MAG: HYR domain-containing protein, partial [Bacteroidetes bacterium]|nr:HYR domain-containing protein [Bacteroidota bacterium]
IVDGNNSGCTFPFVLADPGTCSNTCNISASGLSNIQCNNNGTPSDDTDDYITFDLNPTGTNLGTTYTVNGAILIPSGGTYGFNTSFQTLTGTAGTGNLTLTIIDDNDPNCSLGITVIDPGTCSSECDLSSSGYGNLLCLGNGTPYDPSDDSFSFDLNPTGLNLSPNGYSVSSSVNITPSTGNYGNVNSHQTESGSTGNGDLNITITDLDDNGCAISFLLIDPTPNPNIVNIQDPTMCGGDGSVTIGGLVSGNSYNLIYNELPTLNILVGGLLADNNGEITWNIAEGNYSNIRIQDGNTGCIGGSLIATLNDPASPVYSVTGMDPTSCNGSDGLFTLSGLSINASFTITYNDDGVLVGPLTLNSNSNGEIVITGLNAGNYTNIILTNAANCSGNVVGVVLSDPSNLIISIPSFSNPSFCGAMDGSITIDGLFTGNNHTVDYILNGNNISINSLFANPNGEITIPDLSEGNYTNIIVTDNFFNCTGGPLNQVLTDPTGPSYTIESSNDPTTCGGMDGSIVLAGLLANTNYQVVYEFNGNANSPFNLSSNALGELTILNLLAGNYTNITLTINGCIGSPLMTTLNDPFGFTLSETHIDVTCPNGNDGSIDLTVITGVSPFLYDWDNDGTGDNDDNEDLENLSSGTYSVTVTDALNCTKSLSVDILNGVDNIPPIAVCQDLTIQLDGSGSGSITPQEVDNGSSDNCGNISLNLNNSNFNCSNVGFNTVTLTVTDDSGNTDICSANINVEEIILPIAVCQDITVELNINGTAFIIPQQVNNGSSDNCGNITLSLNNSNFNCDNIGNETVILSVTDNSGNTAQCSSIITIEDNQDPIASCLNINISLNASGDAIITPEEVDNGSSDNCDNISLSLDNSNFNCSNIGSNNVLLTVTDPGGNIDQCTAVVTIEDTTAPDAICQDITIAIDSNGNASITPQEIDNGSSDNCGTINLSLNNSTFNCSNVGVNTVTLTVDDGNGNTNSCTSTVTVEDNFVPAAVCQNIVVSLDTNGEAIILAEEIDNGSSDNCGTVILSLNQDIFFCNEVGSNSVTLTVDDGNGNSDSCNSIVTVEDNLIPNAVCNNITVQLDFNGSVSITPQDVDGGSSDNCGISTLNIDIFNFNCDNLGTNNVILTVNDVNGNSNSCTSIVTVEDIILPAALCQDISVFLDLNGTASITATEVNNGSSDNCGNVSLSINNANFNCNDIGNQTVVLSVMDDSGNIATCAATVTVIDDILPIAACEDISIDLDLNGNATILPQDVDGGSSDNCGTFILELDIDNFDCSNVGSNAVILTIQDGNGNTDECSAMVTVQDNLSPSAVCLNITVSLDTIGVATIVPEDLDGGSSDNCSVISLSIDNDNFNCADIGSQTIMLTVDDNNGNSNSCMATVVIQDDLPPIAQCQDLTVQLDMTGEAIITPQEVDSGSSDNCSVLNLSLDNTTFDCSNVGVNTVTLTLSDISLNTSNCTAQILIEDLVAPTASCQNISINLDQNGITTLTPQEVDAGSSDNCGNISLSIDNESFSCDDIGTQSVILTVIDDYGNSNTCNADVEIIDNLPPIANCQDITVQLDGDGSVDITASQINNGSTDNCSTTNLSIDISTFNCSDTGINAVTLSVDDGNNNLSTCSSIVNVEDNFPPLAFCQDITIQLDGAGNGIVTANEINNGSSDNCTAINLSLDISNFDCSNVGTNVVVLTVDDENGNSSFCNATVNVLEDTPPIANCQNLTVILDDQGMASITPNQVNNGSTDNCGFINFSLDIQNFDCSNEGLNTVNLLVEDGSGNSSSCMATISVVDDSVPIAICQDITIALDDNGLATITPQDVDGGSFDNCSNIDLSIDINSFTCIDIGPNTVLLTVDDNIGSANQCNSIVTVEDNISPTVTCMDVNLQLGANDMVTISAQDILLSSDDNCGIVNPSLDINTFDCSNIGQNLVTLTGNDGNGNQAQCNALVMISEDTPPNAVCQNISMQLGLDGLVNIIPSQVDGGSTDNCGSAQLSIDIDNFDCSNIGLNVVTLTVNDGNGNESQCMSNVTIIDDLGPMANCQNITVELDSNGEITVDPNLVNDGSIDNCQISSITLDIQNFNCNDIGSQFVVLTATDQSGNSSQCFGIVDIEDNLPPVAIAQDITILLDNDGNAIISADLVENGSFDNCGIESYSIDLNSFNCDNVGENEVILSVIDESGNMSTDTAIVLIAETDPPIALSQDITVTLDGDGLASITAQDIDNGSFDNCGINNLSINIDNFDCSDIGANTVILTVTDGYGNMSASIATVTVIDDTTPALSCPITYASIDCQNFVEYEMPTIEDNCTNGDLTLIEGLPSGSQFPNGITIVTWQYMDLSGNSTTCSFEVDAPIPLIISQILRDPILCNGGDDGAITVFPQGGIPSYTYLWSNGQMTQTAIDLSVGNYSVTVTDTIGCEVIAGIDMPEPDPLSIQVDSIQVDTNMTSSGGIFVTISGGMPSYNYSWFLDGEIISNDQDPQGLAAGEYTVQITDNNGCIILSDLIIVDGITGTREPFWASELRLMPNPTSGQLFLEIPNLNSKVELQIFNLLGKNIEFELLEKSLSQFEITLDFIPSGIYLVQITAQDLTVSRKIMVTN